MKLMNLLKTIQTWVANAVDSERHERWVNGDFMRRARVTSRFKKFARNVRRSPQKLVMATGFAVLLFYVVFGDYGVIQRIRQESIHHKLERELLTEQQRTVKLEAEIENAKSLETIEKLAREKYNLSLKDEIIYKLK